VRIVARGRGCRTMGRIGVHGVGQIYALLRGIKKM
jgi:hypothetical protein